MSTMWIRTGLIITLSIHKSTASSSKSTFSSSQSLSRRLMIASISTTTTKQTFTCHSSLTQYIGTMRISLQGSRFYLVAPCLRFFKSQALSGKFCETLEVCSR